MRVVFDTNILLSGIGWHGAPFRCLELARRGVVNGLTCKHLLDELTKILLLKLAMPETEITDTVTDLLSFLELVPISGKLRVLEADPSDDRVLECAIAGAATYIVTGDHRHLLPMGKYEGIPIVTAADFLRLVSSADRKESKRNS